MPFKLAPWQIHPWWPEKLAVRKGCFVASPDYLSKYGVPEIPDKLDQHNCITLSSMMAPDEWIYTGPKGEAKVPVSGNLKVNNPAALREAVLAGIGLTAAPPPG
ncbi:MAG: LysR substrate-binding domain-containing protein [Candidatus Thiodiazotropha sp. (ex. Lucinoma kazani)]